MASELPPDRLKKQMIRSVGRLHTFWYRATGGLIGGWAGGPSLLLTTTGRKSGKPRTLPLLYLKTARGYALVASFGGSDQHPAWYLNLEANPEVEIQVGPRRIRARAQTADEERRAELWPRLLKLYGGYASYQQRTERKIPVVELVPESG